MFDVVHRVDGIVPMVEEVSGAGTENDAECEQQGETTVRAGRERNGRDLRSLDEFDAHRLSFAEIGGDCGLTSSTKKTSQDLPLIGELRFDVAVIRGGVRVVLNLRFLGVQRLPKQSLAVPRFLKVTFRRSDDFGRLFRGDYIQIPFGLVHRALHAFYLRPIGAESRSELAISLAQIQVSAFEVAHRTASAHFVERKRVRAAEIRVARLGGRPWNQKPSAELT